MNSNERYEELSSLDEEILQKRKEYKELDLKYRELLTKYDILDNLDELVTKKNEVFKELQKLKDELNDVRIKVSKKEEMMRYDAKNLIVGIVKNNGYSIRVFTYFEKGLYYNSAYDTLSYYKIYKDIDNPNNKLALNVQKAIAPDYTNVNVKGYIDYIYLAELIGQKFSKGKSVTSKDIEGALSVFANYDLSKVNMEEIVYSLKAITKIRSRKRRFK